MKYYVVASTRKGHVWRDSNGAAVPDFADARPYHSKAAAERVKRWMGRGPWRVVDEVEAAGLAGVRGAA